MERRRLRPRPTPARAASLWMTDAGVAAMHEHVGDAAEKLWATGVQPQGIYGGEGMGWAPSLRGRARRAARVCACKCGAAACVRTRLAWHFGEDKDPEISLQVETLELFITIWEESSPTERADIDKAWGR